MWIASLFDGACEAMRRDARSCEKRKCAGLGIGGQSPTRPTGENAC